MIYMFCYDIADPKRLRQTAKLLESYGIRVQRSFFQCEMSQEQMHKMKNLILEVIDIKEDYLFIYPLCEKCCKKADIDGVGEVINLQPFEII